jgi:hypothetical protein
VGKCLKQAFLFASQSVPGPIENRKGAARIIIQERPRVTIATDRILPSGQNQRRAREGRLKLIDRKGKRVVLL